MILCIEKDCIIVILYGLGICDRYAADTDGNIETQAIMRLETLGGQRGLIPTIHL